MDAITKSRRFSYKRVGFLRAGRKEFVLLIIMQCAKLIFGRNNGNNNSGSNRNNNSRKVNACADIHAREWIAPAVLTYLANELLAESAPNGEWDDRFWDFNWYFVPSVNPDGYQYTWDVDRLWRKTRSG
jgi:murein tripeptide amidase MpaA